MKQKQLKKIIWKILQNSIENDEDKNNQKVDSSNETATTLTEKQQKQKEHQVKK